MMKVTIPTRPAFFCCLLVACFAVISCKTRHISTSAGIKAEVNEGIFKASTFVLGEGVHTIGKAPPGMLRFCSFNIQFLGMSNARDNPFLVDTVKNCDILAVQELVSHPESGVVFPDQNKDGLVNQVDQEILKSGKDIAVTNAKENVRKFFDLMVASGFKFHISDLKTGSGDTHANSSSSEYFVTFFRPEHFELDQNHPPKFVADKTKDSVLFKRVPYAITFRTVQKKIPLVVVNVHLHFATKPNNMEEEFNSFLEASKTLEPLSAEQKEAMDRFKACAHEPTTFEDFSECAGKERGKNVSKSEFNAVQRYVELQSIYRWAKEENKTRPANTEWVVVGDMNISDSEELKEHLSRLKGVRSLNKEASVLTTAQGERPFDHAFVPIRSPGESSIHFPETLSTLSLVCRAALLKASPMEPGSKTPPPVSTLESTIPPEATCLDIAKSDFREKSLFFKLLKEEPNQFWTAFRLRYSDHNPIFFDIKIL
jgi:hypothetical protein